VGRCTGRKLKSWYRYERCNKLIGGEALRLGWGGQRRNVTNGSGLIKLL